MPRRSRAVVRGLIFNLHLYVGLGIGLVLVSAGLSGSILVFRNEIDTLLYRDLRRTPVGAERISVQRVVDRVSMAYPAAPPVRIRMPRAPEETYEVTVATRGELLQVYVDPYRGTVVGSRGETETFTNALFAWHTTLFAGEIGKRVLGITALLLLALVASGIVVWWPGVRRLADGFRVKWSANRKRVNYDLHRATGIWTALFLTAVAVTGASLIYPRAFMAGLDGITRSPPRPRPAVVVPRPGVAPLPLDALLARAERALPGGMVTYITLPARPDVPLTVRKRFSRERHPNGRNFIDLDPWTGRVLTVEDALRAPAGTRAFNVLYPIHIGRWGGPVSRVTQVFLGLSPLILFLSGGLMWWNRTQAPKRRGRSRVRYGEDGSRAAPR